MHSILLPLHSLLLSFTTLTSAFHPPSRLHTIPRPSPPTNLHHQSSSSSSVDTETLLNESLTRWLLASSSDISPDLHSVRIDTNAHGLRGLYANRDIREKEIIFEIPYGLALETGDTLMDGRDGEYLIGRDLDGVVDCESWNKDTTYDTYQALQFLNRMENDEEFIHDPYICNLPPEPEPNDAGVTPDFWEDELIDELEIPSFIREIKNRKRLVKAVAEKNDVDEHELRWATWMIRSRRFTTWDKVDDPTMEDDSLIGKLIPKKMERIRGFLLPLIDMANHCHDPNAVMHIKVNKWTRKFDDTSSFALRALKPIVKDEELTILYGDGDWTCLQMMDKYGFFLEGSKADEKFDWKSLDCDFSTTLEQDEEERDKLLNDPGGKHGSRIDMLSLRLNVKRLLMQ